MSTTQSVLLHKYPRITDDFILFNVNSKTLVFNTITCELSVLNSQLELPHKISFACSCADVDFDNIMKYTVEKQQELYRNRHISGLIIIPTWACKTKCEYCYTKKANSKKYLTPSGIDDIITRYGIEPDDIGDTVIIGGEPLLNPDVVLHTLRKFPNAHHTICSALEVPNDTLERVIEEITGKPNVEISISIDASSSSRYAFDGNRYIQSIELIKYLHNRGVNVRAKSVLSPVAWNITSVREAIAPIGLSCDGLAYSSDSEEDMEVTKNVTDMFADELERIISTGYDKRNSFICFSGHLTHYIHNQFDFARQDCGCGINHFTITPDGEMSICDSPNHESLDDTLSSNELETKMSSIRKPCNTCHQFQYCGGSCEVYSTGKYNLFCTVRQLKFAYSLYLEILKHEQ